MAETVEQIAEILNNMRLESQSGIQDIETALEKIYAKIETSDDNEENYEMIKVYLAELKKVLEDKLSSNLSELTGENSQQIQQGFDKQTLQLHTVFNNVNEVKDAIENLKLYFSQIDNVVKNSSGEHAQLLSDKLQNIENLLTYNTDEYKEKLQDLQNGLYEFAKTVESSSAQSDSKIETSLNELSELKNSLVNVFDYLKSNEESNDEIASNIASILNDKIGTVIDGMESINENLKNGVSISLQEELSNIQRNFNEIITIVTELKESNKDEVSQNILEKLSSLNDELILLNNDVAAIVLNNREEIIKAFDDFKNNITDFIDNGIVSTISQTKSQLETSFYAMADNVNSKLTESSQSVGNLEQLYEKAFDKLDVIEDFVSDKIRNDIELLNNVFQSGVRTVKSAFKDELEEKYDALKASVDIVLNDTTVQDAVNNMKAEISAQIGDMVNNSQTASAKHEEILKSISGLASNMRLFVVRISQLVIAKYNPEKTKEILESLKSDNTLIQDALSQISTKIENSELAIIEDIGKINTKLDGIIGENLTEIGSKLDTLTSDNSNLAIIEDIGNLSNKVDSIVSNNLDNINSKLDEIRTVPENLGIINTKIDTIASDNSNEEILSEIDNLKNKLNEILSEKLNTLDEKLENIKSDDTNAEIIENINNLNSKLGDFALKYQNIDEINEKLTISNTDMVDSFNTVNSKLADISSIQEDVNKLNFKIDSLSESDNSFEIVENINNLNSKLTDFMTIARDINILNEKVDTIAKDDSSVEIVENINNLNSKLTDFMTIAQDINILNEKIDTIASNDSTTEIVENINNLNSRINDFALISQDVGEINAKVDTLASDMTNVELADNINEMRLKLTDIIELTQNFTDLSTKIDMLINGNADVEILENITNLNSRINDFMLISSEFTELNSKLDTLTADKSNIEIIQDISDMNAKLDEFSSMYDNISIINSKIDNLASDTSNMELIEDVKNITERLDHISSLTDNVITLNTKLDTIVSDNSKYEIIDDIETVNKKLDDIVSETLNTINAKVDAIAADESNQNILDEIDDIKNIIYEQQKLVESSADERAHTIDKYLKDVLTEIDNLDVEKNAQDIKDTILTALLSLVDQISFVEETEEIKDFVEEKTDSINKTLTELKDKIRQLINPDDDGFSYVYTLQDVESDIAKLRLAVNNLQNRDFSDIIAEMRRILTSVSNLEKSLTHEEIEKIKEDLLSISVRTNKLLLNSEESSKTFTDSLSNFSGMVDENTRVVHSLDMKLDNIKTLAESSSQADKVFHQSLMYLGEWIDSTTENIASISERVYQIPEIKENVRNIENSIGEASRVLNVIEEKYEEQNSRIDKLENKLKEILMNIEKNDNNKLDKKLDRIEKMISGLSGNIDKLTSYVDE